MGFRGLVVILSLVGCSRAPAAPEPGADSAPSPPLTETPEPTVEATVASGEPPAADARTPDPSNDARTRSRPERDRLQLLERRGDSEGPIPYRVVEPAAADAKTPLVIALHGRGDTAEGFARLAMELRLDARIIVGEAPLPFGNVGGRQWFVTGAPDAAAQVRERVADLGALIDKLAKRYPETGKPAVYGFSQGAVVALQAAREIPDRLAAVAALSGYLMSEDGAATPATPLPVLVTAGTKDGIITQDRSWAAADVLEEQGLAVERFAFQGPHSVPPAVLAKLRSFLSAR